MTYNEMLSLLPARLRTAIEKYKPETVTELRLNSGQQAVAVSLTANLPTGVILTGEEIAELLNALCGGSLHTYGDTLREGYLPLPDGWRVGVCGTLSGGEVIRITSLCIRIPHRVRNISLSLCRRLITYKEGGCLIYAAPGVGKTTLLRDMAVILSSEPYLRRVAVVDSRQEIYRKEDFSGATAAVYLGYPKAMGISLACRTMDPEYILCDEIGPGEGDAIADAQSCGVPLIATAHGNDLRGLLAKPSFRRLHEIGVFGLYAGVRREGGSMIFDMTERSGVRV